MNEETKVMYTDEELLWATQVAYCNIDPKKIQEYLDDINNHGDYPTLQYIFANSGLDYDIYYNREDALAKALSGKESTDEKAMRKATEDFIDGVKNGDICKDWKVVSVLNDESGTGLYALVIETDEHNAIVAFRGSESVSVEQKIKDWIVADYFVQLRKEKNYIPDKRQITHVREVLQLISVLTKDNGFEEASQLTEEGVQSISLAFSIENGVNGGVITKTDGTSLAVGEFSFEAQTYNTKEIEEVKDSLKEDTAFFMAPFQANIKSNIPSISENIHTWRESK